MMDHAYVSVFVLDHPLAHHILTELRSVTTQSESFRRYAESLTTMLILEATREMQTAERMVMTPIKETVGRNLSEGLAIVPILRAGLGMTHSVLEIFPNVAVGYIGLERDENTAEARRYYSKLPKLEGRFTLCLDPMLATGGTACQAISLMKSHGAKRIAMVFVISAPEGIAVLQHQHPDVAIYTGVIDEGLNELKYIVPGLGDFGDRLFGTI